MKLTHSEVPCECKKRKKVVLELTEDEAAHLSDDLKKCYDNFGFSWNSTLAISKKLFDLAGKW